MLQCIFKSFTNLRHLELKTESDISLIYILKGKGPKVDNSRTPDFTICEKEKVPEV
jgi:hypothetical protein